MSRRAKGSGGLLKKGATWYLRWRVAGQETWVSLRTGDRRQAEAKAKEKMEVLGKERDLDRMIERIADVRDQMIGERVTVAQAWDAFKDSPRRKQCLPSTLENYRVYWSSFASWMARYHPEVTNVTLVQKDHVDGYLRHLWRKDISARTYNAYLQGVRMVGMVVGVGTAVFDGLEPKKGQRLERAAFTKDQAWKILEALASEDTCIPDKEETLVLWVIGICTGFRLGDAVNLLWESVDLRRGVVIVTPAKTRERTPKRTRGVPPTATVPIHPQLREALELASGWRVNEYILPDLASRMAKDRKAIDRGVSRVLDKVDLVEVVSGDRGLSRRKYGYHSCRHFFCSECARVGVPLSRLAMMTGDLMTTLESYYIHGNEDQGIGEIFTALSVDPGSRLRDHLISGIGDRLRELDMDKLTAIAKRLGIKAELLEQVVVAEG